MDIPSKLGIGIITYNRLDHLKRVVESVLRFTAADYFLVVADDGSVDGTRDFLSDQGITTIGTANRGIAWNKNRALYALRNYTPANTFILLEDDTCAERTGWEADWVKTVERRGYATYAHPKVRGAILAGTGSPDDPFACTKITSQCSAVSKVALDAAGYFDTRFHGYGVEDGEWSTRLRKLGFGIIPVKQEGKPAVKANCMIQGGVHTLDVKSYRDNASVERNRLLYAQIRDEPMPRLAWRSPEEEAQLLAEIEAATSCCGLIERKQRSG